MSLSRRNVLKLAAGSAAMWATGVRAASCAACTKIPVGLQLYSVRQQAAKDPAGVIAQVAQIGYKGVEYAGYYGKTAEELRKIQDANKVVCCGTHTGWPTIQADKIKETIEFNKILGNKYLVVPGLPKNYNESKEKVIETAKIFSEAAAKAKEHGMFVGYHAHGFDFKQIDGQTAWDILFSSVSSDVIMQLDIGNCLGGGGNPYETLKKFPGKSRTVHLKEHGGPKGAATGEGEVKWPEVFQICESVGKTEWYIVEHESNPTAAIESVGKCFENLKKMGKA